jgi:hypothetical protein
MSQQEQEIDHWTQQLEALLLKIAHVAQEAGKRYYIGGGFAVDLTFGGLSRPHEDIDFHPMEEDTQWWKDWFTSQGYLISKDPDMNDYPYAFLPTNEKHDYFADVYPVKVGFFRRLADAACGILKKQTNPPTRRFPDSV